MRKDGSALKKIFFYMILLLIIVLIILFIGSKLIDMVRLESLKETMPSNVLAQGLTAEYFPADSLNELDLDGFHDFRLMQEGQGFAEFNNNAYAYCCSDNMHNIVFFSGADQGSAINNIKKYESFFYLYLGKHTLDYDEVSYDNGYFNGYHTEFSAGRLRIKHTMNTDIYVMSYRIFLNNKLNNVVFTAFTTNIDNIMEAKSLLDYATKSLTDTKQALQNIQDGVTGSASNVYNAADVTYVPRKDASSPDITDKDYLANGDVSWQQDGMQVIQSTNYDYKLELENPYDCLHVSYVYMDITQVPDSIILIDPNGVAYEPTSIEQYKGEITFKVNNAVKGTWILSVRHNTSLGGSSVEFMEQSKWDKLNPLLDTDENLVG